MDKYELLLPCPSCKKGTMHFVGSIKHINIAGSTVYKEIWRCDNCINIEWQEKTDFIFELERAEESPLNEPLRELIQAKDEMLAAIKVITNEYKKNHGK